MFGNSESQVTKDGKFNEVLNGIPDWVYEEEFGFNRAFDFSADSQMLAYIRFDESQVPMYSLVKFVANIKAALAEGDMKKAQQICDSQRGSVANVVNATLKKYAEMENDTELSKDQKLLAIQKELEEATALELPMMEQNLPIIGTSTTLGTLMGFLGTVIGMIRSFAALAAGGSADSMALSQGISEALINTAFGILTGALAVISYNYYTNKIDKLTYSLDEIGFSIVQTFAATHK